jgi:DNA-binding MarR family transcriptional regulator
MTPQSLTRPQSLIATTQDGAYRKDPRIQVIAERFGVDPSTVHRISRPFDGASVAVA